MIIVRNNNSNYDTMLIESVDIDDLVLKVKSKRYTYNRIRRMLIHILIGLLSQ